jgi:hypothetical protein
MLASEARDITSKQQPTIVKENKLCRNTNLYFPSYRTLTPYAQGKTVIMSPHVPPKENKTTNCQLHILLPPAGSSSSNQVSSESREQ